MIKGLNAWGCLTTAQLIWCHIEKQFFLLILYGIWHKILFVMVDIEVKVQLFWVVTHS